MKFDDKHSFDKPSDTVLKMFSDKAYFERKYKDLGFWNIEVIEHTKTDTKFKIKVRYSAKNDAPVPDFAKKFMADSNVVTQSDSWDLVKKTGKLEAEIKGVPVKVMANMALKDEGSGCANHLKWDLDCGIPFIGGKLEQVIAEDIKNKSKTDIAKTREILKGY